MLKVTLKGSEFPLVGVLPAVGTHAPDVLLTGTDLRDTWLSEARGWRVINIFPSVDTPICATSVRTFNARAALRPGVTVLNVSMDLPFAHGRFCAAEGLAGVYSYSTFRSTFADEFGVRIAEGPLAGLCARAVVVLDPDGVVVWTQLVPDIGQEPDYDRALASLPEQGAPAA